VALDGKCVVNSNSLVRKNVAFYDILYLWFYYRPVDRELSRNFLFDRSRPQVGHPWYRWRKWAPIRIMWQRAI